MDWLSALAGLLVGTVVGVTGVGGGSLMSPILILLFNVAPTTAVGTDLWFAAITKTFGSALHHRQESADWGIARRLWLGSIPAAIVTVLVLSASGIHQVKGGTIAHVLGATLIVSAALTPFRQVFARRVRRIGTSRAAAYLAWQPAATVAAGALLGFLVTLTSVGAGAIGATLLLLLYPLRLSNRRMVGTDILHAVPVAVIGGVGYLTIGEVDGMRLLWLLVGSIPGILIGARLTRILPDVVIQPALAIVLFISGLKLLTA